MPGLTIVGLGPAGADLLTVEARDVLAAAADVWLRTSRHPAVAGLPAGPEYRSFDEVYERGASFEDVYAEIVSAVDALAARPGGVVYAVPGHPLHGEATVRRLLDHAAGRGLEVRIVPGLSFLDVLAPQLALDPLGEGLLLLDALSLDARGRALAPQRPTVIAQVYDGRAASQLKLALLERYPADHPARVVCGAGTGAAVVHDVPLASLDHDASMFDHLTSVYLPPLAPFDDARSFEGLRAVVAQLRAPEGGCPWDLEQTHASLKRYLIEEAYEALEALDEGEPHRLAEELGDLMMQVLLHAQIAEDANDFAIEDVIESIARKLVRRHPHVFGDVTVEGSGEVLRNWEVLKRDERGDAPLLNAVPKSLPALAQAQSVLGRAAKAGLDPGVERRMPGVDLEVEAADARRIGELLFAIVALAREHDIDAEEALRAAIGAYRADVARLEDARRPVS